MYIQILLSLWIRQVSAKNNNNNKKKVDLSLRSVGRGFSFSIPTYKHTHSYISKDIFCFLSQMCDIDSKPINKIVKLPSLACALALSVFLYLQIKAPRFGAPKYNNTKTNKIMQRTQWETMRRV